MKTKHVVGGLVIALCVVVAFMSLKGSMTPYVTIREAKAMKRMVQVAGTLVHGTTSFNKDSGEYTFEINDKSGEQIKVRTKETLPSNFEQSTQVVAKGVYDGESFNANTVLVKCPSKYQKEISGAKKHPEDIPK